jgi:hypothetical protein
MCHNSNKNHRFLVVHLDCCYAGKMAMRLKNNRKIPHNEDIVIHCSSGPNDISYDLHKFGGTLIAQKWALQFPDYVLPH